MTIQKLRILRIRPFLKFITVELLFCGFEKGAHPENLHMFCIVILSSFLTIYVFES